MTTRAQRWQRDLRAALAQTRAYWLIVAALPDAGVGTAAWCGLWVACLVVGWGLWRRVAGPANRAGWALLLLNTVLLALLCFGADRGLAALHGPQRGMFDVAATFDGLELWFVFSPGATSVVLSGWVRARVR